MCISLYYHFYMYSFQIQNAFSFSIFSVLYLFERVPVFCWILNGHTRSVGSQQMSFQFFSLDEQTNKRTNKQTNKQSRNL
jgi:hypothetical protein